MQKPKKDAFKEDVQGSGVKEKDAEDRVRCRHTIL